MTAVEHEHRYEMQMHLDGCHFYSSAYRCKCGSTVETLDERSPEGYGAVWMSEGEPCERCDQLLAGAEPKHQKWIDGEEVVG